MRDEDISSGGNTNAVDPTPAASSVGASFPALPENAGSGDCLGGGLGSKTGSLSGIGAQLPLASLSTSAGGSALGSSQPSCRPWERGDLLRRLSTFNPDYWFGKPKASSSLTCACRGWVNVDIDKIECEACGASLKYTPTAAWLSAEGDGSCDSCEDFAKHLDLGHKGSCPWRGNTCPESLVQFPPTPPPALIGGYKDRCDGLFQFAALPVVAASTVEQMCVSRGLQIDRLLTQTFNLLSGEPGIRPENITEVETSREDASLYSRTQKLISLCGWEPRWFLDVQDCEEHSAQSARNGCSVAPTEDHTCPRDPGSSKKALSTTSMKDSDKNDGAGPESKCESRSPLLDCSLCGATVKIWDFITVPRPARVAINDADIPETSKKMVVTCGVSAASGISGWAATDARHIEGSKCHDEAATTDEGKHLSNTGVDLNLTMAGGLSPLQLKMREVSQQCHNTDLGKDLMIGQPSNSEGNRATSYESRGPVSRKRSLDDAGSTIDRPFLGMQQADSAEATVIDCDGDEVNDGSQYLAGPSKRVCDSIFGGYGSSYKRETSGAGPSQSQGFEAESDALRFSISQHESNQFSRFRSNKDSIHASSLIAMDTVCLSVDENSMDSVENVPGTDDDVRFWAMTMFRNPGVNDNSELKNSNQAQQSACFQPVAARSGGEMGVSSINDGDEVLNTEIGTAHAMDGLSMGMSGGSVGMGASHEAEIHGTNMFINRSDSGAGDTGPVAEVVENQGQTGEFGSGTRSIDNVVDQELHREDPHGDSQDIISLSVGRADSRSKVFGSTKADSVESGEKISNMQIITRDNSAHPSLSCNALVYSGFEVSKEEVSQDGIRLPTTDFPYLELGYTAANGIGPPNGESNYEEGVEFDPIRHHNSFCPWVNGNVAAAGCNSSLTSSAGALALCGWQMTLDALDAIHSLGHIPVQPVESESAASMYKVGR